MSHAASPARQCEPDPCLVRRACLERREQLLMDVVEAAVRHDDDEIAVARLARDGARRCPRSSGCSGHPCPPSRRSATSCSADSRSVVRQRRSEDGGQHDAVRLRRMPARNPSWNIAAARGRRARLEDRPDAAIRDTPSARPRASRQSRSDGARSRRRPRRRAAVPRCSQPAAHALERAQPVGHRVGAQPDGRADGDRGERVADVVGAEQRHLEGADRRSLAAHAERRRRAASIFRSCACQSRAVGQPERFDPAARLRLRAPAPRRCRRRAAAGRAAGRG